MAGPVRSGRGLEPRSVEQRGVSLKAALRRDAVARKRVAARGPGRGGCLRGDRCRRLLVVRCPVVGQDPDPRPAPDSGASPPGAPDDQDRSREALHRGHLTRNVAAVAKAPVLRLRRCVRTRSRRCERSWLPRRRSRQRSMGHRAGAGAGAGRGPRAAVVRHRSGPRPADDPIDAGPPGLPSPMPGGVGGGFASWCPQRVLVHGSRERPSPRLAGACRPSAFELAFWRPPLPSP
jgi:hypothetical protein